MSTAVSKKTGISTVQQNKQKINIVLTEAGSHIDAGSWIQAEIIVNCTDVSWGLLSEVLQ